MAQRVIFGTFFAVTLTSILSLMRERKLTAFFSMDRQNHISKNILFQVFEIPSPLQGVYSIFKGRGVGGVPNFFFIS